jgi:hypothetical protein
MLNYFPLKESPAGLLSHFASCPGRDLDDAGAACPTARSLRTVSARGAYLVRQTDGDLLGSALSHQFRG